MNWKKIFKGIFTFIAFAILFPVIMWVILIWIVPAIQDNLDRTYSSKEIKELKEFQKKWNKELSKLKERVEKGEFDNIKAENSKWERYKIPYTELLPEFPDMEENNKDLFGIDSNNNGVRDDLEILTVKEFWNDRDVVEVVFAGIRKRDHNLYLYKNDLISDENIKIMIRNNNMSFGCYINMLDLFRKLNKVYKKQYNSKERKKAEKVILRAFAGNVMGGEKITKGKCGEWIEELKNWMYRNK